MKPSISGALALAHAANRREWMSVTGEDCYLEAFCDVMSEQTMNEVEKVRRMSNTLLHYIAESMATSNAPLYQHFIAAANAYAKQPEAKLDLNIIATAHLKICGLLWKRHGVNFYHPILVPIKRAASQAELNNRIAEVSEVLTQYGEHVRVAFIRRMNYALHSR